MKSNQQIIDTHAMVTSLGALQPSEERSRADTIAELYPAIRHAMSRGVTAKAIMADLQRNGLKLHPARFKELMAAEAALRDEKGERLHCLTCQAVLPFKESVKAATVDGGEA